jgi:hypothetical protein
MRDSVLRIYGRSGFFVGEIRHYLAQVEDAYNSLYTLEVFVGAVERSAQNWLVPYGFGAFWGLPLFPQGRTRFLVSWPPTPQTVAPVVPPRDRLLLKAVNLESPGFWDFMGTLNPLEVIRQYLNDRHERRKDREYREAAEARRLELENRLLENRVIQERIEIARHLGATEQDLTPLLNEFVYRPLRESDRV